VTAKGLMSIATKVVIQMNAKLGGEPWSIQIPIKTFMFVGFDVHKAARGSGGAAIGAMVSSTSITYASYFSTISYHKDANELSVNMANDIKSKSTYIS
jgi:aubergine-like protein